MPHSARGPHQPQVLRCPGPQRTTLPPVKLLGAAPKTPCERWVTTTHLRPRTEQSQVARLPGNAGRYLEQAEGGHPARAALLVLCTQHPQLLCVLQDFVWLKEGKEAEVSGRERTRNSPQARVGLSPAHNRQLLGVPTGTPFNHHTLLWASKRLKDGHVVTHRKYLYTNESIQCETVSPLFF